ncbi:hypothetical protein PoB_000954600 [Plakobranchus ocellatus]|uniref:Uncharacterized protein n=1 Tax=Plakobranchus ocellatus TaxID=259542 RepID=A0AAV3YIH7_9GAST|nr:hypothetical protein PoB_000954600 [Plakobranchus ocellatus]
MQFNKFKDKNVGGRDTLLEKKIIYGLKDAQSGNQGQEEETGADRKQDGFIWRAVGLEWQRKTQDRKKLKTSAEGYILQWMDKASKNQSNEVQHF